MHSLLKSPRFSPSALEVTLHIVVCVLHHGANYREASKEVKTKHLGEKYIPSSRRFLSPKGNDVCQPGGIAVPGDLFSGAPSPELGRTSGPNSQGKAKPYGQVYAL